MFSISGLDYTSCRNTRATRQTLPRWVEARNPVIKVKRTGEREALSHKRWRGMSPTRTATGATSARQDLLFISLSFSLHQISLSRSSGRCDDCCVSLHRSEHPVDPGVGCERELRGLPWRPPLPRHWQRCSIEPFWLLGRICFQPSCNLSSSRRPLRPPRAERVSCLFGKLIETPDSLSIVDREWRKFCDSWFSNIRALQ